MFAEWVLFLCITWPCASLVRGNFKLQMDHLNSPLSLMCVAASQQMNEVIPNSLSTWVLSCLPEHRNQFSLVEWGVSAVKWWSFFCCAQSHSRKNTELMMSFMIINPYINPYINLYQSISILPKSVSVFSDSMMKRTGITSRRGTHFRMVCSGGSSTRTWSTW